jgi:hypothetical protein
MRGLRDEYSLQEQLDDWNCHIRLLHRKFEREDLRHAFFQPLCTSVPWPRTILISEASLQHLRVFDLLDRAVDVQALERPRQHVHIQALAFGL